MRTRSTSRARIAHPELKNIPVESCHTSPGEDDLSGDSTLNRRSDRILFGGREKSRTNKKATVQTLSARVMVQCLRPGRVCQRLQFIPC